MSKSVPKYGVKAHLAISQELVRVCLTGDDRPELAEPILDDRTQTKRKARRAVR